MAATMSMAQEGDSLREAIAEVDHRAMVDPLFATKNAVKFVRKVAYGSSREARSGNCWWLQETDDIPGLGTTDMSEAEQRALIEAEPAFKTTFLMGFGDPGRMISELVVLPDYNERGEAVKGSGAYIGPDKPTGADLEVAMARKARAKAGPRPRDKVEVDFVVSSPPAHLPRRQYTPGAMQRRKPRRAWGGEPARPKTPLARALAASVKDEPSFIPQGQLVEPSRRAGAHTFAGNPRNRYRTPEVERHERLREQRAALAESESGWQPPPPHSLPRRPSAASVLASTAPPPSAGVLSRKDSGSLLGGADADARRRPSSAAASRSPAAGSLELPLPSTPQRRPSSASRLSRSPSTAPGLDHGVHIGSSVWTAPRQSHHNLIAPPAPMRPQTVQSMRTNRRNPLDHGRQAGGSLRPSSAHRPTDEDKLLAHNVNSARADHGASTALQTRKGASSASESDLGAPTNAMVRTKTWTSSAKLTHANPRRWGASSPAGSAHSCHQKASTVHLEFNGSVSIQELLFADAD
mmetsp:Transcript_9180/g.26690  ORF Transcript_9180/g.26690 Transcript_9180/m.26690 type:complete len:522 (-) Transcript_9180:49-1614(-)